MKLENQDNIEIHTSIEIGNKEKRITHKEITVPPFKCFTLVIP